MFSYFVLLNVVLMSDVCIVIVEYSSIYVVYRLIDTSIIKSWKLKTHKSVLRIIYYFIMWAARCIWRPTITTTSAAISASMDIGASVRMCSELGGEDSVGRKWCSVDLFTCIHAGCVPGSAYRFTFLRLIAFIRPSVCCLHLFSIDLSWIEKSSACVST